MKLLFLRGQIPQDRNSKEIVFDKLEDCDDMWTQLAYSLSEGDYSELWYWGGRRKHHFTENFVERWITDLKKYTPVFTPDVILCRGGFKEYHAVLKKFPDAIKIYYGAGRRFLPQKGFTNYDIILQDSEEQLALSRSKFPNSHSTLFIKPAADNMFYPRREDKIYDVCFPANAGQDFKGHGFIYESVPSDIKLLNLGNNTKKYKRPSNVDSFKVKRNEMASNISKCKVGIVAVSSEIDSCPRVIPEMLACNIPIVVLDSVRFWKEKYITEKTGILTTKNDFWYNVRQVLDNLDAFSPKKYYDENLSLAAASSLLRNIINRGWNENSI